MTEKRYNEIKAVLTDKKWNAAEFAAHAEKLLPELFAGIDKGQFEAEPEPAPEIAPAPAEPTPEPVGEPLPEIQDEPTERQSGPVAASEDEPEE